VLRGSGRRPGFIARIETEGLMHPERGGIAKATTCDNRGPIRRECTIAGTRDSDKWIRCYACGNFGHVAKACTTTDGSALRISSENEPRVHGSSPAGQRQ
jgi:hypothetical protein